MVVVLQQVRPDERLQLLLIASEDLAPDIAGSAGSRTSRAENDNCKCCRLSMLVSLQANIALDAYGRPKTSPTKVKVVSGASASLVRVSVHSENTEVE